MKIIIDLDVVTVALWNKNKEALDFLERVKKGEFEVYTPYILLDLVASWKFRELKEHIVHFYNVYSSKIVTIQDAFEESKKQNLRVETATMELLNTDVKEEDAALVILASIFPLDYLVTYNRKHLLNKINMINEVLRRNGFREIKIALPSEL